MSASVSLVLTRRNPTEWYFCNVTRDQSRELLSGQRCGFFVLRPSSQPDSRALDFVERKGTVKRSLIRNIGGRWKLDTAPELFDTCEALIYAQPALLHKETRAVG